MNQLPDPIVIRAEDIEPALVGGPTWVHSTQGRRRFKDRRIRGMSPSVEIILDALEAKGLRKVDLARRLGVSPEYIYRILNGKVSFPGIPETLERLATILGLDPMALPEYAGYFEGMDPAVRFLWQRMRELGHTRETLYEAMKDSISRPYFYGILRGEHPITSNPRFAAPFARVLRLTPEEVTEHFNPQGTPEDAESEQQIDLSFHLLLIDHLIAARGYGPPRKHTLISSDYLTTMFLHEEDTDERVLAMMKRMGHWGLSAQALARQAKVGERYVIDLFYGDVVPTPDDPDCKRLQAALDLG